MNRGRRAGIGPSAGVTRRQLLQLGSIGVMGLGLPELLHAAATRTERRRGPSSPSCIFIVQYGGASHIDSWDLKPLAPQETRGPYKPIATTVPGVHICELMPRLASMAHRYCLVRSMTHRDPNHDGGMHVCMTGHSQPLLDTPYYGSVMAKLRPATRSIPSYVWLQNLAGDVQPRYLTGGFLGAAYSPLRVGTDEDNPSSNKFRMTAFDVAAEVSSDRLRGRRDLLAAVDAAGGLPRPVAWSQTMPQLAEWKRYQAKALEILTGPDARRAFDIDREPVSLRDRYGRHPLGQNLLMARRLVEAGVRLVSVTAWAGTPPTEKFRNVQTWDMHGESVGLGSIFGTGAYGLGWALPRVDEAVSGLLEDLEDRGLLDSTLVVMVGEFGRSPHIVKNGRDHWPACYSALLAGAGVRGGMVYGSSDRKGAYVQDRPVSPEDFGATLFHALGVRPETRLSADGFTRPASEGKPILELFS